MRVGDVLDRSFELLRREWRAAVLLGGVYVVAFGVIIAFYSVALFRFVNELDAAAVSTGTVADPELMAETLAGAIGLTLVVIAFSLFLAFASLILTGVSVRAAMHGPEEGSSWSDLGRHIGPATVAGLRLLGWGILFGLAVSLLLAIPFVFVGLLAGSLDEAAVPVVVLLVVGVLGLFFLGMLALSPILMAMTGLVYGREAGVWRAVGDGYRLVRRAYWPSLGSTVVVWLFSLVPFLGSALVAVLTPVFQVALIEQLEALDGSA